MIGNDHLEFVGPGFGEIKPVDRAGAVKNTTGSPLPAEWTTVFTPSTV
jgi:hypothetical protein